MLNANIVEVCQPTESQPMEPISDLMAHINEAFRQAKTGEELKAIAQEKALLESFATDVQRGHRRKTDDPSDGLNADQTPATEKTKDPGVDFLLYPPGRDTNNRQFQYIASVEDTAGAKQVLDCLWQTKTDVTMRELAAMSPDIRKGLKEAVTGRRVLNDGKKPLKRTAKKPSHSPKNSTFSNMPNAI
jgi:hypothetical protein